ncbi:MAG: galactosamine-6-phosphate isomerase [Nitrospinales bacterium]
MRETQVKKSYELMSLAATKLIMEELCRKSDLLICAASGNTPTLTYKLLCGKKQTQPKLFEKIRIIKLDEWNGMEIENPTTCEFYLQKNLIKPLEVSDDRYISFCSNSENPELECKIINKKLCDNGPIDLCVLGLGMNGHVGLNEPAEELKPYSHVVRLSVASQKHSMLKKLPVKPVYGLSLGIKEIFNAKRILLLISGQHKNSAMRRLFTKKISTQFPASLLWLHHNTVCLCDQEAADGIDVSA